MSKKAMIIGGIIIILLIIIVTLLFMNKTEEEVVVVETEIVKDVMQPDSGVIDLNYLEQNGVTIEKEDGYELKSVARNFIARYGSFSNDGNYRNFTELYSQMTPVMQSWVDRYVADMKNTYKEYDYIGFTTQAVSVEIIDYTDEASRIQVTAQRMLNVDNIYTQTYQQSVFIDFVNQEGWKINGVFWQEDINVLSTSGEIEEEVLAEIL